MTTLTEANEEFARQVMTLANPVERFQPTAIHDPDGDCIEFFATRDAFYANRMDELVTVYYSQTTNEVVGALIKGISKAYEELGQSKKAGLLIRIKGERGVRMDLLFIALMWTKITDPEDFRIVTYQKLADVSHQTEVEGELCGV